MNGGRDAVRERRRCVSIHPRLEGLQQIQGGQQIKPSHLRASLNLREESAG